MKSIIKFAGLCFLFTCTFLIMSDIEQVTARKDEAEEALSISMRNTLKASTYQPMYEVSDTMMQVEFIRSLADNINTDSTFDLYIMDATIEGLLDVQMNTEFVHNNGKQGIRELRKTLLVEKPGELSGFYKGNPLGE